MRPCELTFNHVIKAHHHKGRLAVYTQVHTHTLHSNNSWTVFTSIFKNQRNTYHLNSPLTIQLKPSAWCSTHFPHTVNRANPTELGVALSTQSTSETLRFQRLISLQSSVVEFSLKGHAEQALGTQALCCLLARRKHSERKVLNRENFIAAIFLGQKTKII